MNDLRNALGQQYKLIYFHYMIRMKRAAMDAVQEIFPFVLVVIVRELIEAKIRNLPLNLSEKNTHHLLISMVYEELHGISTS